MNSLSISIIQETIGLLAARDEIDTAIASNIDQMLREGCLVEGVQTSELSAIVLRNLTRDFTPGTLTESPENTHAASPSTGASPVPEWIAATPASPASPPAAAAPQELATAPPASVATPAPLLNPISVLKLAKGWEEKLIERGVQTVGDLGKWIYEGKLVPGFAPRVGPDAVEKIKSAWRGYVYPNGVGDGGVVNHPTGASPKPDQELPQKTPDQIRGEGAEFARLGYKACENPHPKGTSQWVLWDEGWQQQFSDMDASDEATEEVPAVAPQETAGDFPEMNLAGLETQGMHAAGRAAAAASTSSTSPLLDTSDL